MNDWINGWSITGTLSVVGTLIVAWLKRNAAPSTGAVWRKPLQFLSASGRRMVAEDALDFTTSFNTTLIQQRDRALAEIVRLDKQLERTEARLVVVEDELERLKFTSRDHSTD